MVLSTSPIVAYIRSLSATIGASSRPNARIDTLWSNSKAISRDCSLRGQRVAWWRFTQFVDFWMTCSADGHWSRSTSAMHSTAFQVRFHSRQCLTVQPFTRTSQFLPSFVFVPHIACIWRVSHLVWGWGWAWRSARASFVLPCSAADLESLGWPLGVGYMDDLTLRGSVQSVADVAQAISDLGVPVGLRMNPSKCEFVGSIESLSESSFALLHGFNFVDRGLTCLLGAPLSPGPGTR